MRSQAARPFRAAGIACALAIALYFAAGGKAYYPGAVFTFLLAAGAVPLEHWLAARAQRARAGRISPVAVTGTALVASAMITLPVALPVLPARALHSVPLQKINYDLAETIGWPKQVDAGRSRVSRAARRRNSD